MQKWLFFSLFINYAAFTNLSSKLLDPLSIIFLGNRIFKQLLSFCGQSLYVE